MPKPTPECRFSYLFQISPHNRWSMVDGRWSMVDGRWSMVDGRWSMVDSTARLPARSDRREERSVIYRQFVLPAHRAQDRQEERAPWSRRRLESVASRA